DNERNRKLVRTILEFRGYEVVECDDGGPALELARQHRPALVLMDIQLPTVDGITALLRLRADPETSSIPVVAVTASVTPGERDRVVAAGFNGYVSKPIDVGSFGGMVDGYVGAEAKA
ncbi:MAG: response regulator, partial [Gemmatimonadales bacterium]